MKVIVCTWPPTDRASVFNTLEDRWRRIVPAEDLIWIHPPAKKFVIHGQLLREAWPQVIAPLLAAGHDCVLTEVDFVAYDTFLDEARGLAAEYEAVLPAYYQLDVDTCEPAYKADFSGAWLCVFSKDLAKHNLPDDFLAEGGPYNDACNLSYQKLLHAGCRDDHILLLEGRSNYPTNLGIEYDGFGTHFMYGRDYDKDPSYHLFGGVTVGQHLASIYETLAALGDHDNV
jgi:hypothetical protein